MELPRRQDLPPETTWDLSRIYPEAAAWEEAQARVREGLTRLGAYRGRLEDPKLLLEALRLRDDLLNEAQKVGLWASLQLATEGDNPLLQAYAARARSFLAEVQARVAWVEPELLALPPEALAWLREEPLLEEYRHYLERLERRRPHVLEGSVEAVLAELQAPLSALQAAAQAALTADMRFRPAKGYPVDHSTIGALLAHEDPEVRREAFRSYADGHLAFQHTLANLLQGHMKAYALEARLRRYPGALDMALARSFLPKKVYENLFATFRAHLPLWHRYFHLRRKALGGRLRAYDVPVYDAPAPLARGPHIPFGQAVAWIAEGMRPLGEEYVEALRRGVLEERWVDYGINRGKRPGAFASGTKGTPPYVFLSYQEDLFSLSTLAHELGHALHAYYTRAHQPFVYSRYSLFVAEVASNFNQALVRAHLLQNPDPAFRLALLEEAMANFGRYLFTMPILALFEREMYERLERGEALTAPFLNRRLAELFREGFGEAVEVDPEDEARLGISWAFFPHLYQPFYVWQYATGIAAANALAKKVLEDPEAKERYLDFLKAGDSLYPLEALRLAGVDLERPEPLEEAFRILEELTTQMEALLT
ncbi:MAG: M3 family oligoendopeptidase [Thermus sp.]|uniref:M3 family oligoendopeptidase n=1 Tax=Thermus sp. TaxID=275 RepID=UPI00351BE2A1